MPLVMFSKLRLPFRTCIIITDNIILYFKPQQNISNRIVMLKTLHIPEEQLSIAQRLLYTCKKPAPGSDGKPEIDFLLLDREIEQLQQLQSKTCQQIVEFVDEHREQFIKINTKFQSISSSIHKTQLLIKKLLPKIDTYKNKLYSQQSKMQEFVTDYEKKLMQQQLSAIAKEEADFLSDFVVDFEQLININVEDLTQRHKYHIVRFLRKKQNIKSVFDHPLIKSASHNTNALINLIDNISEQLEFYLSEQLSRIAINRDLRSLKVGNLSLLQELQIWYRYIGKEDSYFQIIQDSIVGKELSALQSFLISHKQSLIVGKQEKIVQEFFDNLFNLVQEFPIDYPKDRILKIIYKFLGKKQLNFMYSYVVPTFPLSYNSYKKAVEKIKNQSLKKQLEVKHGWNLKFWADLRIKSIMDRSAKERQNNLSKWIQIVFKKNFMIYGVRSYMVKLAFLLVNRFCRKIQQQIQFSGQSLNQAHNQLKQLKENLRLKLQQGFQQQLKQDEIKSAIVKDEVDKIAQNILSTIENTLGKWIITNMEMILSTCKSSLQQYKSFVMKTISKKDKHKTMLNSQQIILKPLHSYFKNNPQLSEQCCKYTEHVVLRELQEFYDSEYAKQIYNYCHSNVTTEQMKVVMEVVALERQSLFLQQNKSKP